METIRLKRHQEFRMFAPKLVKASSIFDIIFLRGRPFAQQLLAKQLHPDRYARGSDEVIDLANGLFDKVRDAWDQVGDPESRQKYCDHVLDGKPTEEEEAMETVRVYMEAEAEFKRGLAAFNAGRITQAHKLFESASEAVPDEIEFEVYLAYTTYNLNRQADPQRAKAAMIS